MLLIPTEEALITEIRARLGTLPEKLGVAVSGGSDSMALLHLLNAMSRTSETEVYVATVDHGLRRESRQEAECVAARAAELGLQHDILTWHSPAESGNLQGEARAARYRLLALWAKARGLQAVAVGHTADDQAETLVMRLRRASGVTGLSGMSVRHLRDGIELLRPLLRVHRKDLRTYLTDRSIPWIDDPSNNDTRFERVRVREALTALEPLGLTIDALTAVADNMRMADAALDHAMRVAAAELGQVRLGAVVLDRAGFHDLQDEVARRLLVAAITYVSGADYPPRRAPLLDACHALREGRGLTLQGCQLVVKSDRIWVCREYEAVRETCIEHVSEQRSDVVWDNAWKLSVPPNIPHDTKLRALGDDGLRLMEDWRRHAVPREVLKPLPAVWQGGELIAVPPLEQSSVWSTAAMRLSETWATRSLSH
ncbi:tRNA lysidine(34) synthetase TilS [Tritonibacter sp. SIMBA_163]|uniref:tRNA lysidine(34) synthetase TilS n=1 Tax=Tritonibacter sp. SIMBA_163 TaxID=3080868 RepID=UPI00397F941F